MTVIEIPLSLYEILDLIFNLTLNTALVVIMYMQLIKMPTKKKSSKKYRGKKKTSRPRVR